MGVNLMKNYQKPVLKVVELQVKENIAALVPKTSYDQTTKSSSAFQSSYNPKSEVMELESYGTSNQTA